MRHQLFVRIIIINYPSDKIEIPSDIKSNNFLTDMVQYDGQVTDDVCVTITEGQVTDDYIEITLTIDELPITDDVDEIIIMTIPGGFITDDDTEIIVKLP
tara:strand:+ start:1162 stop:1461 length:300 start_codon:yes stop_codon:yes gene_type:complete